MDRAKTILRMAIGSLENIFMGSPKVTELTNGQTRIHLQASL